LSRESLNHQERLTEDKVIEQADVAQLPSSPKVENEAVPSAPAPSAPAPPKEPAVASSDHQWTDSIRRIEDLLDDELRLKALLAPITDTGEPLLRDLTHRVRAFRNVFRAWEELHIDPNDGQLRHISGESQE
jgi:alpha 1,3-mannosyltransferase